MRWSNRERLSDWLANDLPRYFGERVLPVDARVSRAWGRLMADGRRAGREPPVIDGLLVATALVHELVFVTRNVRDCAGRGVSVYDPWNEELS